jgi:radical SAM superfamily enzyme YgiQ (UPF0313 family)
MRYKGQIIRPPNEANSYLLQVTYGCSWNKCHFCPTYIDKPFQLRPLDEIEEDITLAKKVYNESIKRVFLCDGDAFVLSTEKLIHILKLLSTSFPYLNRVGAYFNAKSILSKSIEELRELAYNKLKIGYIGLESGSNNVLKSINKCAKSEEILEAVLKAKQAGMKISVIALLGLGGISLSREHAIETARIVSEMNPDYFSLLTLMLVKGTRLYQSYKEKKFFLLNEKGILEELQLLVENLNLEKTIFRTNHASNYLSLEGVLSRDKDRIIETIKLSSENKVFLRPDFIRGL